MALISDPSKASITDSSIPIENNMPVLFGNASVPIEIYFSNINDEISLGLDIVFIVDNSGSMDQNDGDQKRFSAINGLSQLYAPTRNAWDRIAVITFQGDAATILHSDSPWHRWSEIPALLNEIGGAGGYTPMNDAMAKANQLLTAQNSFYRLAILLSDGYPVPDNDQNPQTTLIENARIQEACNNRILYSTIYLRPDDPNSGMPADNSLLIDIAQRTDYISGLPLGSFPRYYFKIADASHIQDAYNNLLSVLISRPIPQQVRLHEKINLHSLFVDPSREPQFTGDGFTAMNVTSQPTLSQALNGFIQTGVFDVTLNELKGDVKLSFSVKLNLSSLTNNDFAQGAVVVDVDDPESIIRWLEPVPNGSGNVECQIGIPQTKIKFLLSAYIQKTLMDNGNLVEVDVDNISPNPLQNFEIFEIPSGFSDMQLGEDNFSFSPLELLFTHRIVPWFESQIFHSVLFPNDPRKILFLREMISAHQALIHSRPQLDSLLKIFSTFSDESDDIDPAKFWRSTYPRGVYLLAATIPPLANHHVKIKLANASHLRTNEPSSGTTLMAPTDSVGKDITDARSSYQYRLMDRTITGFIKPNPYRSQTVHPGGHPDLFLRTCLNYADKDSFRELFLGGDPHNNSAMWRLLDSPDISLVLHRPNPRIITSDAQIQITNGGDIDAPAGALLTVTAYLLPYSGSEVQQAPFHILPTLVTRGSVQLPSISFATNSMPTVTAVVKMDDFEIFYPKPFPPHLPPTVTVPAFVKAIAITVAEISQVKGESLLSNNKAIEITQVEV